MVRTPHQWFIIQEQKKRTIIHQTKRSGCRPTAREKACTSSQRDLTGRLLKCQIKLAADSVCHELRVRHKITKN